MTKAAKPSEWAKRIEELLEATGLRQAGLAGKLESDSSEGTASQGTVSNWLRADGNYPPSARMYVQLGNVAVEYGLDPLWFWEQAGFDPAAAVSLAEQMLKKRSKKAAPGEMVEIPLFSTEQFGSGAAEQADARMFRIPADRLTNPISTVALEIAEGAAAIPFGAGDVLIVDRSVAHFPSLWDKMVAVRLDPSGASSAYRGWYRGLSFGLLRLVATEPFVWGAKLTPLGGQEEEFAIGEWHNAETAQQFERQKAALNSAIRTGRIDAVRKIDKAYFDDYVRNYGRDPNWANTPKTKADWDSIDYAGKTAGEEFSAPYYEADKIQGRLEAQAKLLPDPGCTVIGRMVAWFSADAGEVKG